MIRIRKSIVRGDAIPASAAAIALAAAVAVAVDPAFAANLNLSWALQATVEAIAAAMCLGASRVARGRGRAAWTLLATGQALWSLTNLVTALTLALGGEIPELSLVDVAWLAYYVPTLAAIALLYTLMQPEPGWLGVIDALVLSAGAALLVWAIVLSPIVDGAGDNSIAAVAVNTLYPGLDLVGAIVVGWLVLRRRATPRWTVGLFAFFVLSVGGGVLYMDAALGGSDLADGLSGAVYALSSACLMLAAGHRRRGGPAGHALRARATVPPAWSQLVPPVVAAPLAVLILLGDGSVIDHLALGVIVLVVGRLAWSLLVVARIGQDTEALLRRDPLTGAHNRRFLDEEIVRLAARARRSGGSLAAVLLDLDRFKTINDTLGHATGDALLVRLVSELRVHLRAGDVLCRLGGDEFLVLMPDTDADGALQLARRMLDGVGAARDAAAVNVPIDGSLGVVSQRGGTVDGALLLARADEAMYAAKWAGGGQVVVWTPGLATTLDPNGATGSGAGR